MLDASKKAGSFLESGGGSQLQGALEKMAAVRTEDETEDEEMRMVGPYRLVRKLGRGGMGQVYLAVRDDEAFKRYVAVKVIRKGMDTEDILKRFRVERQILASLTHPNIARLLDGGATEDGLSYFVMEYVDGEPLTKYCDDNKLSLEKRLELFESVTEAVRYAHQNLIVHRDLKPANILVSNDGQVKLLDFGIAKFLNPDLTAYTLPMTRTEVRVMTPEYASPEQVRGNSVTTASDVYQLGILLYELLTGHRPFTFETKKRGEIEKIILEKAPAKPSTMISKMEELPASTATPETVSVKRRTPLERLRRQLSGDLDRIILMALRKETDRRYQSADQLLQDLQNYRTGRPVMAQSDTWTYRTSKFVQRNKLTVTTSAIVLLALVITTIVSFRFAYVTAEQRDQIVLEAQKTEQVKDFLLELFVQANPEFNGGVEPTVYSLLKSGAESISSELEDQPAVQAEMMYTIGFVYTELGYYDESLPLLERSLEIERDLAGDGITPGLAQSLYGMGYLKGEERDREEAARYHLESLNIRRALFGEQHLLTAESLNDLAAAMYSYPHPSADTLLHLWSEALDIRVALLEDDHKDIAETLGNLAVIQQDLGNDDLSESTYRQAQAMIESTLGERHPFYATNLYNFGTLMAYVDLDEAERLFRDVISLRTEIYGPDHDLVANAMNQLGRVLLGKGVFSEAEDMLVDSRDLHAANSSPNDFIVARDNFTLGRLYEAWGQPDKARGQYAAAVSIARLNDIADSGIAFVMHQSLSRLQMLEGNHRAAALNLLYAIDLNLPLWGESDPDIASARLMLGECQIELRQFDEAIETLEKAIEFYANNAETGSSDLAQAELFLQAARAAAN